VTPAKKHSPIPHQLGQLLRPSLALRHELHPGRPRIATAATAVLGSKVSRRRLKDKCRADAVLRRGPHLSVIVKRDFPAEYRQERLAEFGRLGGEHLSEWQHMLFRLTQAHP